MCKIIRILVLVHMILMVVTFGESHATTMIALSDEDLVRKAATIVYGEVLDIAVEQDSQTGIVWTTSTILVKEDLVGVCEPGEEIQVRQAGGVVGDIGTAVPGVKLLQPFDEAVLFIDQDRRGLNRIVGLSQGQFMISEDSAGNKVVKRAIREAAVRHGLASTLEGQPLDEFLSQLRVIVGRVK